MIMMIYEILCLEAIWLKMLGVREIGSASSIYFLIGSLKNPCESDPPVD